MSRDVIQMSRHLLYVHYVCSVPPEKAGVCNHKMKILLNGGGYLAHRDNPRTRIPMSVHGSYRSISSYYKYNEILSPSSISSKLLVLIIKKIIHPTHPTTTYVSKRIHLAFHNYIQLILPSRKQPS